jgi:hypothetical protein
VILALLQGISLVRRNNEWHHFDPLGTAQVITNNSAGVVSNNLYNLFGVLRHQQGSAQTPWRWVFAQSERESLSLVAGSPFLHSPSANLLNPNRVRVARYGIVLGWLWLLARAVFRCAVGVAGNEVLNPNPGCFSRCATCCGGILAGGAWKVPPFVQWDPLGKFFGGLTVCGVICRAICDTGPPSPPLPVDTSQYPGRYTIIPFPYERIVWH